MADREKWKKWMERGAVTFLGLILVNTGVAALLRGQVFYSSWHNVGPVFAPIPILLGLVIIGIAIFGKWTNSRNRDSSEKPRRSKRQFRI